MGRRNRRIVIITTIMGKRASICDARRNGDTKARKSENQETVKKRLRKNRALKESALKEALQTGNADGLCKAIREADGYSIRKLEQARLVLKMIGGCVEDSYRIKQTTRVMKKPCVRVKGRRRFKQFLVA